MIDHRFDPTAAHETDNDVRDWGFLSKRLQKPPNGCFHVLIAPKRAGKTWALRSLEANTGGTYIDLQGANPDEWYRHPCESGPVLVDEPVDLIRSEPFAFMRRCRSIRDDKKFNICLAVTPADYARLRAADPRERFLKKTDRTYLMPLRDSEIVRLVGSAEWAGAVAERLPGSWKRNAFLLTCALYVAEQYPGLRDDIPSLLGEASGVAIGNDYVLNVAYKGLSRGQLAALRACAGQHVAKRAEDIDVLRRVGLIHPESDTIEDPILATHFAAPIVVHHLTDIHVGPKSALTVDQKDESPVGSILADAMGQGLAREAYLTHIGTGNGPHIAAVTGDVVEHGANAEQLAEALGWMDRLRDIAGENPHDDLQGDDPRVVIVGGNHDVDWGSTTTDLPASKRHEPFAGTFSEYPHPQLHLPDEDRLSPFVHFRGARFSLLLLGSAEFGGQVDFHGNAVDPGSQWIDYLLELLAVESDDASRDRLKLVLGELGVDVEKSDVDSRLKVQRVDPGLVSRKSLDRSRVSATANPPEALQIALLHHPLSPLPSAPEVARYAGLTNAGQVKDLLLSLKVDLALHGHLHRFFYAEERWPERHRERAVRILAAPSLGTYEKDEPNGYNEIKVFREGDAFLAVEIRCVRFQSAEWKPDDQPQRFVVRGSQADDWALTDE
jgi:hypothetical protein